MLCQSSVIQAILGELPMTGGQVDVHGDISYSPQESWVFAGTSIKAIQSSVIQAILGELPMTGGQVDVHGDISYSPQESWVFAGTSIKVLLQYALEEQQKKYKK